MTDRNDLTNRPNNYLDWDKKATTLDNGISFWRESPSRCHVRITAFGHTETACHADFGYALNMAAQKWFFETEESDEVRIEIKESEKQQWERNHD